MGCVLFISIVQFSRINLLFQQRRLFYQIFVSSSSTFLSTFRIHFSFLCCVCSNEHYFNRFLIHSQVLFLVHFRSILLTRCFCSNSYILTELPPLVQYFFKYNPDLFSKTNFSSAETEKSFIYNVETHFLSSYQLHNFMYNIHFIHTPPKTSPPQKYPLSLILTALIFILAFSPKII